MDQAGFEPAGIEKHRIVYGYHAPPTGIEPACIQLTFQDVRSIRVYEGIWVTWQNGQGVTYPFRPQSFIWLMYKLVYACGITVKNDGEAAQELEF